MSRVAAPERMRPPSRLTPGPFTQPSFTLFMALPVMLLLLGVLSVAAAPVDQPAPAQTAPAWTDPSPHTVRFVDVAPDVKLEVLDWGGEGGAVVLLAGSGHTGHVFDDLAPKLRQSGHVYAITRRGYGASSRAASGYDDQRLADDVLAVLRALALKAPVLVGHSMAGGEITTVGRQHPASVGGLIYLDALADPRDPPSSDPAWRALNEKLPPPVAPCREDLTSFAAFTRSFACSAGAALPEAAFRSGFDSGPDGRVGRFTTSPAVHEAIGEGHIRRDYEGIRVPVLAVVDLPRTTFDDLPLGEQPRTSVEREALRAFAEATRVWIRRWEGQLRRQVADVRIVELVGAGHYLFASREREVLAEAHRFLRSVHGQNDPPSSAGAVEAPGPPAWTDPSPHTVRFVDVAPSVKLEVLDWGGSGRDVVLLTGSGHTAHVYDEFALKLKLMGAYHVYGITRRGYGASSVPESGYDEPSLSNDVWKVIETLGLKSPVLIGHSMAGAELTGVGMLHSDRIGGLVYLDAIGDSTDDPPADPAFRATQAKLPPAGPAPDCRRDRSSFAAFRASLGCSNGLFLPEAELRAGFEAGADGSVGSAKSPGWVSRAIGTGRPPRKYSKIKVPVLAISDAIDFDLSHLKLDQPQPRNDEDRAAITAFGKAVQAVFDRWSANLKRGVPDAKIVNLPGAGHYLWMTSEGPVLREIHAFIKGLPATR
jgi:pimeloyl-ACP methyl ester carboxylesterase